MKLDQPLFSSDRDAVTRLAEQIVQMLMAACCQDPLFQESFESIAPDSQDAPAINVLLLPTGQEFSLVLTAKS